jgi:hypothetical protein
MRAEVRLTPAGRALLDELDERLDVLRAERPAEGVAR